MLVRATELRMLDVVNLRDGRKLGNIVDLDVDARTGEIRAVVLPSQTGFSLFGRRRSDVEITWERIVKIGIDVILVDLPETGAGDRHGRDVRVAP